MLYNTSDVDTKINFEIMQEIMDRGFSRIPVYEESQNNIVGLLFVKDLAFVDPDDELPVETMVKFHKHCVHRVSWFKHYLLCDFWRISLHDQFVCEYYAFSTVQVWKKDWTRKRERERERDRERERERERSE